MEPARQARDGSQPPRRAEHEHEHGQRDDEPRAAGKGEQIRNMSAIRGKDTQPERVLRSAIFARGLRFRLHVRGLPGSPDLVFARFRAVVFVHGCFWHRHFGCRFTTHPKDNATSWQRKFAANVQRDEADKARLAEAGWRVAIVRECALKQSVDQAASALESWLKNQRIATLELGAAGPSTR